MNDESLTFHPAGERRRRPADQYRGMTISTCWLAVPLARPPTDRHHAFKLSSAQPPADRSAEAGTRSGNSPTGAGRVSGARTPAQEEALVATPPSQVMSRPVACPGRSLSSPHGHLLDEFAAEREASGAGEAQIN
jgi:hypothetical protein